MACIHALAQTRLPTHSCMWPFSARTQSDEAATSLTGARYVAASQLYVCIRCLGAVGCDKQRQTCVSILWCSRERESSLCIDNGRTLQIGGATAVVA
jgi:hypothetical protein